MFTFYFFSKIFNFFLNPFHWILILLIFIAIVKHKKWKRNLALLALVVFLLFTNKAILHFVVNNWQPQPVNLSHQSYNAGILLGGISVTDKNNKSYLWQPADRFIQTVSLYKQGVIKKIIVSGGSNNTEAPAEADFLKQELMLCGIPATDILSENQSRNTFENATFTKRIADSIALPGPFVLITSAMHIPRAKLVFNKAGLQVVSFPCNYEVVNNKLLLDDYILPKPQLMEIWARFLKEITGIWVYKLAGKA